MSDKNFTIEVRGRVEQAPETVFSSWTDPASLRRWWRQTPTGDCTECEIDPRPGGAWRIVLADPAHGDDCVTWGTFRALEAPRRLAFTWSAETSLGAVADTLVEIDFRPDGETATEVVIRHSGLPDTAAGRDHEEGWGALLASLAEELRAGGREPADTALDRALEIVDIADAIYVRSEFSAPWGVDMGAAGVTFLHVLLDGPAQLQVEGTPPVELTPGDLVLIPHGVRHSLRDAAETPVQTLEALFAASAIDESLTLRCGGGGRPTRMICGVLVFADRRSEPLLSVLPDFVRIQGSNGSVADWLAEILRRISEEAGAGLPGGQTVIVRLTDIVFIRAVRQALEAGQIPRLGWLDGLQDPQDRGGPRRHPSQPCRPLDGRRPGGRGQHVPLRLRLPLHRTGRTDPGPLRDGVATEPGGGLAALEPGLGGRNRVPRGL